MISQWTVSLMFQITCLVGPVAKFTIPLTRMKSIDVSCFAQNY